MNKQSIPTFSLARQVKNLRPQLMAALEKVLDSQMFIGGTFIQEFEKQVATYLGVKHVISCNSGTDALWMALDALKITKNDIVLTTPFSFIASSSEIVAHGGHPVFIDIQPDTFNIDPALLADWLEKNATKNGTSTVHRQTGFPIVGIIPVDIFGQPADHDALKAVADEWNLWIIQDCAQSFGAELDGKKAGTLGNIGAFSCYPTKNFGAFGDAGFCVTNDPILADRLLQIRNHGRKANYEYEGMGINSRLDAFQAVVLLEKLPLLDSMNARRAQIAQRYNTALADVPFIKVPVQKIGTHVYHQYSMLVETSYRQVLEKHLLSLGVQTRIFYPESLPMIKFLRTNPELATACPVSEQTTQNILSLPMWPELTDSEVDYVIECVKSMPYASTIKPLMGSEQQVSQGAL